MGDDPFGGDMPPVVVDNPANDPFGGDTPVVTDPANDPFGGDTPPVVINNPANDPLGGDMPPADSSGGGILADLPQAAKDFFKSIVTGSDGKPNPMGIMALATLLSQLGKGSAAPPVGYQGGIPSYTAVRQQIPYAADPNRRPGAGGRQYFTPMKYVTAPDVAQAQTTAASQAQGIAAAAPKYAPSERSSGAVNKEATGGDLMARVRAANPNLDWSKYNPNKMTMDYDQFDQARDRYLKSLSGNAQPETKQAAQGGLMNLAKGRYLNGSSDGMADKIPANIEGKQPARLSHGEFVIPADVVSHLGNGNSEAGAERLYSMMDRIRKARTGTPKQGKQINPDKYTPA